MKTLFQKLPLIEGRSFIAKTFETPLFETPFHQHDELELVLCNGSQGTVFIGDYISEYCKGEIYLLGKNLPHWFRKRDENIIGRSLVVQFNEDIFIPGILKLPEFNKIHELIINSRKGIKLKGNLKESIHQQIINIEGKSGFEQLIMLLNCLHEIGNSDEYDYLNENYFLRTSKDAQNKIGLVFEYTMNHYQEKILLKDVASLIHQSVPGFCKYFKTNTKKTYIQFLNQVRIDHACKLIKNTNKNITDICYECGFSNWANFSVQFKKSRHMTPSQYRKMHS